MPSTQQERRPVRLILCQSDELLFHFPASLQKYSSRPFTPSHRNQGSPYCLTTTKPVSHGFPLVSCLLQCNFHEVLCGLWHLGIWGVREWYGGECTGFSFFLIYLILGDEEGSNLETKWVQKYKEKSQPKPVLCSQKDQERGRLLREKY